MTDKKKPTDDLLEGFDDAFDDEIEQVFHESDDPLKTKAKNQQYQDEGAHNFEKTEFLENNSGVEPLGEKVDEKTQINLLEEDDEEDSPVIGSPASETTRGAYKPQVSTEDLSSLFQEDSNVDQEGNTDDQTSIGAGTKTFAKIKPDDLAVEGKTEVLDPEDNSLASMIDSDLLEPSGGPAHSNEPTLVRNNDSKNQPENLASDLSALFDEQLDDEGKTEDISSVGDGLEEQEVNLNPIKKFPDPPIIQSSQNLTKKDTSKPYGQENMAPMQSELSETQITKTKNKNILIAGVAIAVIAIGGGAYIFLKKNKTDEIVAATDAKTTAAQPEKVVESAELLKELEEKYAQTAQYFLTDRYQSYTEATNHLDEILATFPNHKKANARQAEAILLRFDGYLDNDRKNRVYQLLQKAEELDPNSVEALRAKARMLMVEGKNKDAAVRIGQALSLNPNDASALLTQGEILFADKDYKNALASFNAALAVEPASVRSKYFMNLTKEELGDLKGAKAGFAEMTEDMNSHPKSVIEKYAIAMKEGTSSAKADLEQYLTDKEKDLSPSEASRGWKVIANQLLKQGNKQGAIDALEKAVSKMALDHKASFQLGNLYFEQKDYQKASQHYSTSATLDPDNMSYLLQLGISLREQGRLKEAEEQLKKVTLKEPNNFDALYEYAYTRYKLGYGDEVMTQLTQNIKEHPQFVKGEILLGIIQFEKNNFKEALANFNTAISTAQDKSTKVMALKALGDYYMRQELWTKAKQYYTQASEKDPENYDVLFALAKIDIQLNQIDEAQAHLRQMQKINPASIEAKVLHAGILVEQKQYDKAIEVYRDVIKARDSDYETRILLAKVYMDKKQFPEALQELTQAYKYNADYYYTYYYMGLANRGLGDIGEAERNLNKAIALMPKFYKAHYELGLTYLQKDEVEKGAGEIQIALGIEPTFVEALVSMGDYYFEHTSYTDAENYYNQALKIQPSNTDIMLKQAKNYHEMNRDKQSTKLFQKILQIKPNSASIYYELGIVYEEDNHPSQALRMYQKSVSLSPKDPKPYYQLGFLYKDLRQNTQAVNAFRIFLKLSPDAPEKADIQDQINKLANGKI